MPHVYSSGALLRQRERAVRLVLVRLNSESRNCEPCSSVRVKRDLAPRVKAIAASLDVHSEHCKLRPIDGLRVLAILEVPSEYIPEG